MNPIKRIRGTRDILPQECTNWTELERIIRQRMFLFNYQEIRTPVFELTELFARGIGELTDIVTKEMYTFSDRSKKSITLKPEMTAPVMRAYHENNMQTQTPLSKLYYISPLFRQERPQAGRLRQFHQFGAEFIGSPVAQADAETIVLAMDIFQHMGLQNLELKINSVGDAACREPYKKILREYLRENISAPTNEVSGRIENNPLRVLDSKDPDLQETIINAPKLLDHFNETSQKHYDTVKELLSGQKIAFTEDPTLVRGLDYYTHTVYEISSNALGAQNALCGGGRYDLLSREISNRDCPAVGFAAGLERILMVLENQQHSTSEPVTLDVFVITMGTEAVMAAQKWVTLLRKNGLSTDTDFLERSVKAQFREANRQQAKFVLILGESELKEKKFSLKNMASGEQRDVLFDHLSSLSYIDINTLKNLSDEESLIP